ncbi:hypothetical protein HPULCUR_004288 [Helicostylum pulchrum]|uniref:Uncharacterized protein n=1 Tax=Helicostylum pulchrum TaxID=562976 RepID=A0ABP9XVZ1_9FUNG
MGKSAKFYKRPSKKEKEGLAIKKIVEPVITKRGPSKPKINVPAAMVQDIRKPAVKKSEEDMEVDEVKPKLAEKEEQKPEKEQEIPDYVDLFSGKKTYKKIPLKRK